MRALGRAVCTSFIVAHVLVAAAAVLKDPPHNVVEDVNHDSPLTKSGAGARVSSGRRRAEAEVGNPSTRASGTRVPHDAAASILAAGLQAPAPAVPAHAPSPDSDSAQACDRLFESRNFVIPVPVNLFTISATVLVLAFSGLGCAHAIRLYKQHRCSCPLCRGDYTLVQKVGSGGFGSVWTIRSKRSPESTLQQLRARGWREGFSLLARRARSWLKRSGAGAPAAIAAALSGSSGGAADADLVLKMVPVSDVNDATEAQREARDLRYLRHRFVVRFHDDFLHATPATATKEGGLWVCIVMERCREDLRMYIADARRKRRPIPEAIVAKWAAQLVSALKYCATKNIVHRDIKSQNVFIVPAAASAAAGATSALSALGSGSAGSALAAVAEESSTEADGGRGAGAGTAKDRRKTVVAASSIPANKAAAAGAGSVPAVPPLLLSRSSGGADDGGDVESGRGNDDSDDLTTTSSPSSSEGDAPVNGAVKGRTALGYANAAIANAASAQNATVSSRLLLVAGPARRRAGSDVKDSELTAPSMPVAYSPGGGLGAGNAAGAGAAVGRGSPSLAQQRTQRKRRRLGRSGSGRDLTGSARATAAAAAPAAAAAAAAAATIVTPIDDVKLGDFGLARSFTRAHTVYTDAGTDVYKAPEMFAGGRRDGRKADVWALGIVLTEMMTLTFCWERQGSLGAQVMSGDTAPLEKLLSSLPQAQYSTKLRLLVRKCLTPDPDKRPSAEQLLRFRFLRDALSGKQAATSRLSSRLPVDQHASASAAASGAAAGAAAGATGQAVGAGMADVSAGVKAGAMVAGEAPGAAAVGGAGKRKSRASRLHGSASSTATGAQAKSGLPGHRISASAPAMLASAASAPPAVAAAAASSASGQQVGHAHRRSRLEVSREGAGSGSGDGSGSDSADGFTLVQRRRRSLSQSTQTSNAAAPGPSGGYTTATPLLSGAAVALLAGRSADAAASSALASFQLPPARTHGMATGPLDASVVRPGIATLAAPIAAQSQRLFVLSPIAASPGPEEKDGETDLEYSRSASASAGVLAATPPPAPDFLSAVDAAAAAASALSGMGSGGRSATALPSATRAQAAATAGPPARGFSMNSASATGASVRAPGASDPGFLSASSAAAASEREGRAMLRHASDGDDEEEEEEESEAGGGGFHSSPAFTPRSNQGLTHRDGFGLGSRTRGAAAEDSLARQAGFGSLSGRLEQLRLGQPALHGPLSPAAADHRSIQGSGAMAGDGASGGTAATWVRVEHRRLAARRRQKRAAAAASDA